jgi:DNA sulfur modification protein DndC
MRDFRRMNGTVQLFGGRPIPGPYTQQARETWLRKLLDAQTWIRANGPAHVSSIELIRRDELQEIRRIWVTEKHELEDSLPGIYTEATGEPYPGPPLDEHLPFGAELAEVLRDVCGDDQTHYETVRALIDIEQRHRAQQRRAGLFAELEAALRLGMYSSADEAVAHLRAQEELRAQFHPSPGEADCTD